MYICFKKNKKNEINTLKKKKKEQESHGKETDDLEQYSRRNCLFLHGFVETNDEYTDYIIIKVCAEELGIDAQQ